MEKNDSMGASVFWASGVAWPEKKEEKPKKPIGDAIKRKKNKTFEKKIRVSKFAQSARHQRSEYSRPRQCCVHSNFQVGLKEDLGDARSESETRRMTNEQRAELSRNLHYLVPSVALSLKTLAESGLVP